MGDRKQHASGCVANEERGSGLFSFLKTELDSFVKGLSGKAEVIQATYIIQVLISDEEVCCAFRIIPIHLLWHIHPKSDKNDRMSQVSLMWKRWTR